MHRPAILLPLAAVLLLGGCGSGSKSSSTTTTTATQSTQPQTAQPGPEGVVLEQGPALAPASSTTQGATVHGIQCGGTEQFVLHVHAHLAVYVNGSAQQIPPGVGLLQPALVPGSTNFYTATNCFYWLHTHAADGIIHIESPSATRVFTLGDFFAEWRQPLSSSQVGSAKGAVTAFVNGKRWTKDPATIPLGAHDVIQLDVGTPAVPFQTVSFGAQGL